MANIYVSSVTGNSANDGLTWATAKPTINDAITLSTSGDTVYVAANHAETSSAATLTLKGSASSPTKIVCASTSANPPTATAATGKVVNSLAFGFHGFGYVSGVEFTIGSGSTSAAFNFNNTTAANGNQVYDGCKFISNGTGALSAFIAGSPTSAFTQKLTLKNCGLSFKSTTQRFSVSGDLRVEGGTVLAGSSTPTTNGMFSLSNRGGNVDVKGFDFSACSTSLKLSDFSNGCGTIYFSNCKLPSGWTGTLAGDTFVAPGQRAAMFNCDSGDTNYRMMIADYFGTITADTTVTRFSGATDGVTPISWKMVSNANVGFPANTLQTEEILRWYPVADGGEVLGTVSFGIDTIVDAATSLLDDEIWVEAQVFSTAGFPLGTFVSDRKSNILGAGATQTASSELWTSSSMAAPKRQTLSVSATVQEAGWVSLKVHLAKPNTTVYVCPRVRVV